MKKMPCGLWQLIGSLAVSVSAVAGELPFSAQWIWHKQPDYTVYNQTIIARKTFRLPAAGLATLRITADSFYRLYLNGQWVNDGPCRSWPEHFQYDVLDVTPYLRAGDNEIRIIARYYGVGDFHHVPRQPGLLAQLDVSRPGGKTQTVGTDGTWETAVLRALVPETPKVSIQMEPYEWYDARLEEPVKFKRAAVRCDAVAGPWQDLHARDVGLLTRQPFAFKSFLGAKVVRAPGLHYCLPAARLMNPGVIEANYNASMACGMATILTVEREMKVCLEPDGFRVAVDGQQQAGNIFKLTAGQHLILVLAQTPFGHQKEKSLRLPKTDGLRLENPLQPGHENPWCFVRFPEFNLATNDLCWSWFPQDNQPVAAATDGFAKAGDALIKASTNAAAFRQTAGARAEVWPSAAMFVQDAHWPFEAREVVGDAAKRVINPAGLMFDNAETTVVQPDPAGDVELCYDLGEQNCGYWRFEVMAEAGVTVDIAAIEYIMPDGRLQHTGLGYRNSMRYITKAGVNRYTSLKRRSGRYVFLTLRGLRTPVSIRHFDLVESTYPVQSVGSFRCSDARLDQIWDISARTLKLCMEDTFTDCPLYEQTHWVGDARNESLLAYGVFGAHDLARRCARLTAQSLEHYPIAGCQTPSSWDCLLPAWSFLWGISTWDYYWATGDREFLHEVYPAVIKNLKGAEALVNERGLFAGPFWNMFDWTPIDQQHKTVTHNSMFLVGAIDAALKEAGVLGDATQVGWLQALRARVVQGINQLWEPAKGAYADSVHEDGTISSSISQHTSFLGILYDVVAQEQLAAVTKNLLTPPEGMVRIGSPFAALYLYEAYEKIGMDDVIIRDILHNYLPMLESGATTVWESYPTGTTGGGRFPTRSHCHAWSAAPVRFLNRIILGIRETSPGGATICISPRLNGLTWAEGTTATARGPVHVAWKVADGALDVHYTAPGDVKTEFVRNETQQGLRVMVNGAEQK